MNKLEYLEQHRHLSDTLIGIISLCDDIQDIHKIINNYNEKLDEIYKQRLISLSKERGWSQNTVDDIMKMCFGKDTQL